MILAALLAALLSMICACQKGGAAPVSGSELEALQEDMVPFMEKALAHHGMDMMFFMLTNILSETTGLICAGSGAKQLILDVFSGEYDEEYKSDHVIRLPGMVSRKKQLVPKIIMALGE